MSSIHHLESERRELFVELGNQEIRILLLKFYHFLMIVLLGFENHEHPGRKELKKKGEI